MIQETARTRAIRRAMHDTYAPFVVRPAVRKSDPANFMGDHFNNAMTLVFWVAVLALVVDLACHTL